MKTHNILLVLVLTFGLQSSITDAQGTAFTYQGRLNSGNAPANGSYDLAFTLYPTNITGSATAAPVTNSAVSVTNGLFTTLVDFGNAFSGTSYWLEIAVSTNDANTFTTLAPRQQLTPTPYAIYAEGANAAGLTGTIASANFANGSITSNLLAGGSVGVPQLTTNIGVWTQVGTNLFYTSGNVSIGTLLSQAPLLVRGNGANNSAAVVGIQITGSENGSGVFGFSQLPNGNGIRGEADVSGSDGGSPTGVEAISGATNGTAVFAEAPNTIGSTFGVYSIDNSPNGYAGYFQGNSYFSGNVGIGTLNPTTTLFVQGNAPNATNGPVTSVQTSGSAQSGAVVGLCLVPGGNGIKGESDTPAIGLSGAAFSNCGVYGTTTSTNGNGVYGEALASSGVTYGLVGYASSPQGYAGYFQGRGYFSGNVGLGNAAPDRPLAIQGAGGSGEWISLKDTNGVTEWHLNNTGGGLNFVQTRVADFRLFISTNGNVGIGNGAPAYPLQMGSEAYCSAAGVWTSVSDRNVKEDFTAIIPTEVLAKVAAMPITQWKYKVEPSGIKHIGPVAQDFHSAFGLGDSDKAIGSVDESGVALAAIQGLNQKLDEKDAEIQDLKQRMKKLEQLLVRGAAK
jgi:hypothetical protein